MTLVNYLCLVVGGFLGAVGAGVLWSRKVNRVLDELDDERRRNQG